MQTDAQSLATQINILTGVMGGGSLLVGGLIAYLKVSTSNAINAAKLEIAEKIKDSEARLSAELARKDLTDQRLAELDRRIAKTEAWKEAVSAVPGSLANKT